MNFTEKFKDPDPLYRPAPLWVWNDVMTKEEIRSQLSELASHGFGGAFVHPRPGLVTEYLSAEWFGLWGYALECAKQSGIKLYIYDENSYPSGFGGGHVSALCPDGLSSYADFNVLENPEDAGRLKNIICVFAVKLSGGRYYDAVNVTGLPAGQWRDYGEIFIAISLRPQEPTAWNAGFSYVDLMRPEVHDTFMKTTYEPYFDHFGADFGDAVPAIFTDEPSVGTGIAPYSFWFANQFRRIKGYDLTVNLPLIFKDVDGECFDHPAEKVRFDYYDTIHELYVKNWIEASGKWCEEHNINFTGHYLEHQWPLVRDNVSPAMQSYYEYHQWPAIDMLTTDYLKNTPTHALTHTIRELRSASNQFGKERALCELYGAGGWDSTFDDYKRMADWVLVNGVNFINQHLTYATIMGARKHDHPQSFDWRQSWWDEYKDMNDYIGRAQWMLTRGKMEQRILVLNPATTGYTVGALDAAGSMFNDGNNDCIKNPPMDSFLELCGTLTREQWDYDLGDEYTLRRHAKVENGAVRVAEQTYSVIIISKDMRNMLSSTYSLIRDAIKAGIPVIIDGRPGELIEGVRNGEAFDALESTCEKVELSRLNARLEQLIGRRISSDIPFPAGFDHMRRFLGNGDVLWFFVNHSLETFRSTVTVAGKSAARLDLYSGDIKGINYSVNERGLIGIPVELARNQSLMICVSQCERGPLPDVSYVSSEVIPALKAVTMREDNVFPILYCDYESGYGSEKDGYVLSVRDRIFRERGFSSDPWDCKVQYRQNIVEHDKDYDEKSGFRLIYRFSVAGGFTPEKIELCAEHPEYCRLSVNGRSIEWSDGASWLDRHIGVADITAAVVAGENHAEITVPVFRTLYEADAIYLRGSFDVLNLNGKWVLDRQSALVPGSWRMQNKPFYSGAVDYEYTFDVKEDDARVTVDADWSGAALSVRVNGEYAGLVHADGRTEKDITEHIRPGKNKIVFHLCGNSRNLLGPHFAHASNSAWPGMWRVNPPHTPDASVFELLDFALEGVSVRAGRIRFMYDIAELSSVIVK